MVHFVRSIFRLRARSISALTLNLSRPGFAPPNRAHSWSKTSEESCASSQTASALLLLAAAAAVAVVGVVAAGAVQLQLRPGVGGTRTCGTGARRCMGWTAMTTSTTTTRTGRTG